MATLIVDSAQSFRITFLPWILGFQCSDELFVLGASWRYLCLGRRRMTDDTRLPPDLGLNCIAISIAGLSNVEHGEELRNIQEQCCIDKCTPWANAPPEAEDKISWIRLWFMIDCFQESLGFEGQWV